MHTSEDVGQLWLNLQADGIYADSFSVGVQCWDSISLEATGIYAIPIHINMYNLLFTVLLL